MKTEKDTRRFFDGLLLLSKKNNLQRSGSYLDVTKGDEMMRKCYIVIDVMKKTFSNK